jgi:hypothetical protein
MPGIANRILLALPPREFDALKPSLSLVDLHHRDTMCEPDCRLSFTEATSYED